MLLPAPRQPLRAEPIPFLHSVRQKILNRRPGRPQHARQQRTRRHAIHVVIAINDNPFLRVDGLQNPLHRRQHIRQQEGIAELPELGLEKKPGRLHVVKAAIDEHLRQRRRQRQLPGERFLQRGFSRSNDPAFAHAGYAFAVTGLAAATLRLPSPRWYQSTHGLAM